MRRTLTRGFLEITGPGVAGTALLIPDTYRKVVPPQRNFGWGFDEFRKVWSYRALEKANKGDGRSSWWRTATTSPRSTSSRTQELPTDPWVAKPVRSKWE
jgi:hypothetical protein